MNVLNIIDMVHINEQYHCLVVIPSLRHLLKIYINSKRYILLENPLADCYFCMCLNCMDKIISKDWLLS